MLFEIDITCDGCQGVQRLQLIRANRAMAEDFCGMLDGTSPSYVIPVPRGKDAPTSIGKCVQCGDSFRAAIVGEGSDPAPADAGVNPRSVA